MTASAIWWAGLGGLLLFAPQETSGWLGPASPHALTPLLGAAFLGFGAMNWIARHAALGNIYGRAVVAGNQTHLTIGAILLVERGLDMGSSHPAYWILTSVYLLGAAFFASLTFFAPGLGKQP